MNLDIYCLYTSRSGLRSDRSKQQLHDHFLFTPAQGSFYLFFSCYAVFKVLSGQEPSRLARELGKIADFFYPIVPKLSVHRTSNWVMQKPTFTSLTGKRYLREVQPFLLSKHYSDHFSNTTKACFTNIVLGVYRTVFSLKAYARQSRPTWDDFHSKRPDSRSRSRSLARSWSP